MKLLISAVTKFAAGLLLLGLLLFLPAGTFEYVNGWLLIALLFVPMLILGIVLYTKAPALLEKRLQSKEKESTQKGVVAVSGLAFLASFILAGLDYRYGWTEVPGWVLGIASVIFLASYGLYAEVMRENAYLSRTIEVQEDQKVVDTGLYGIVRHPMYMATILMFLAMPVILGSWYAAAVMLVYPVVIIARIRNEENVLEEGLAGYKAYKKKVKYRILPYIW